MSYEQVFDSSRWGLIPHGSLAVLYLDGKYAAPQSAVRQFAGVRWNTVLGGDAAAAGAGMADFEPGNAIFYDGGRLLGWVGGRANRRLLATIYTNLANVGEAYNLAGHEPNVRWWLATLDGDHLTPEECAELTREHGAPIPPGKFWGHQWDGGPTAKYDSTDLFGSFFGR
jgi:hypothetical protein